MTEVTDAVTVTHLPTAGLGRCVEFAGPDAAAVLASAAVYWSGQDEWLRDSRPVLQRADDSTYRAVVRVWSAS